jgi:hypothetical protein
MTHRQSQTTVAAKIIRTTVQLWNRVKYWLLWCVYMVRYTVEQRVFLYESYVKHSSARKCLKEYRRKFPEITVPSTRGIRSTGSLMDKKPAKNIPVLTEEKLNEIG